MWAVVEVSDGYPHGGCSAECVWVFDNVDDAEAWAANMPIERADEFFVLKVLDVVS